MFFRRILFIALLIVSVGFVGTGCGDSSQPVKADNKNESTKSSSASKSSSSKNGKVGIRVGSKTVPRKKITQQINRQFRQKKKLLKRRGMPGNKKQFAGMRKKIKQKIINRHVTQLILEKKADEAGIEVSEQEVQNQYDSMVKKRSRSEKMFLKKLKRAGKSKDDILKRIRNGLRIQKYVENQIDEPTVTEQEIKQAYKRNKRRFKKPHRVRARHILFKTRNRSETEARKKAQKAKKQLDQGANFKKLARKKSEDPKSKKKGGDLGYFSKRKMLPPFSKAAFSLQMGEISDPVKTRFGYHIIKKTGDKKAGMKSLSEVRDKLKKQVNRRKKGKKFKKHIEKLKKQMDVEINV
ncbi:MAG: peptidylprolyl isomerase [bacterium]